VSDHYAALTDGEKAHWDEYTRLRELSDWPAFSDEQATRKADARAWLEKRRAELWHDLHSEPVDAAANKANNRQLRYDQLVDAKLNGGSCRRVAQLPTGHATDSEGVLVSERETWWLVSSTTEAQKARKQACTDTLIAKRKGLWHLMRDDPTNNDKNHRQTRYDHLCIATRHGSPYEEWCETHDPKTGEPISGGKGGAREQAVKNARSYLGVSESPPESNRGDPQPSEWQDRVMGFDGQPWCACFTTCMAWDVGVQGGSSAGVQVIVDMARNGQGMFRGWTTDPGQVMRGDMAVIGCTSCHIGLVADSDDPWHTIEGNTSPGSEGSQYNGGCVAEKQRPHGDIVGWALVDYPG
jgi:hypothetical protein